MFMGQHMGQQAVHKKSCPMALTDTQLRNAKPQEKLYVLYDEKRLSAEVPPTGNIRWRLKYTINGKEKRISLGTYPEVSLKDAREKRDEMRKIDLFRN